MLQIMLIDIIDVSGWGGANGSVFLLLLEKTHARLTHNLNTSSAYFPVYQRI